MPGLKFKKDASYMHIQLTNDFNSGFGTVAVRLHQLDETAGCRAEEYKTVATQSENRIFQVQLGNTVKV